MNSPTTSDMLMVMVELGSGPRSSCLEFAGLMAGGRWHSGWTDGVNGGMNGISSSNSNKYYIMVSLKNTYLTCLTSFNIV